MNLYNQYSYNPGFCVFRKKVAEIISDYLNNHQYGGHALLCVSRYLEILILEDKSNDDREYLEMINVSDFVKSFENNSTYSIDYNRIEELAKKYIIDSAAKAETKWNTLNREMLHDYDEEKFPNNIFEPYIKWKKSEISFNEISLEQIDKMSEEADNLLGFYDAQYPHAHEIHDTFIVDDPWQFTRGYGEDKRMVAYLEYISDQLADLRIRKSFQ